MNAPATKLATSNEIFKKNLTESEASAEYGMSVHWYRRSRWAGDGPRFIKLGGGVLYPRTELDAYFDARLVKSTSESSTRKPPAKGRGVVMTRLQDLNRAAFVWAVLQEEPSISFDGHMATFCFNDSGRANAALAAFETGGVVEAKTFSRLRDSLFRRIRGCGK